MRSLMRLLAAWALAVVLGGFAAVGEEESKAEKIALPADAEGANDVLEHSPRHGEFVDIEQGAGKVPIRTWVVYPERKDKAGVVIVIHEIFGLSDWLRAVADQVAAEGFIAVAPDLVSGMGPNGGGTEATTSRDEVVQLVRGLTPEESTARLDAVFAYAEKIPAANGKIGCVGFCWGGSRSFAYATTQPELQAAVVYYGGAPDSTALLDAHAPILGNYGGDDARVNATIEPAQRVLKQAGKWYEPNIYEGAGHGFLRQQGGRDGANQRASEAAWPKTVAFFRKHL